MLVLILKFNELFEKCVKKLLIKKNVNFETA